MKKLFAIVLALCLFTSLLPMTVMAENPAIKIYVRNAGVTSTTTLTMNPGNTTYFTSTDEQTLVKWTETEAPTDKFVKFEYPAEGDPVINVTMKNIDYKNEATGDWSSHVIEFAKADYKVTITLEGENKVQVGSVSFIKNGAGSGTTITGAGKLITNQTGSVSGTIWMTNGDLLIKDTTLDMTVMQGNHSLHHAILSNSGNVTFDNVKITSTTQGGSLVYFGQPQKSGDQVGRYTPDPDDTRKLTIKNSEITATVTDNKTVFKTTAPAVISNSTLKLKNGGSEGPLISPVPTFEGDYTAIAGLAKNADKLDKLKEYSSKKNGSYTYVYIVPGIQNLLPTEPPTEPTQPETLPPVITTPTQPTETVPGGVTQPTETQPQVTQPVESKPAESTPNATEPAGTDDGEEGGSPLKVILIILVVVVVAVGATFGVLFYLKKKKAQ